MASIYSSLGLLHIVQNKLQNLIHLYDVNNLELGQMVNDIKNVYFLL
jgi:hypothetical protein